MWDIVGVWSLCMFWVDHFFDRTVCTRWNWLYMYVFVLDLPGQIMCYTCIYVYVCVCVIFDVLSRSPLFSQSGYLFSNFKHFVNVYWLTVHCERVGRFLFVRSLTCHSVRYVLLVLLSCASSALAILSVALSIHHMYVLSHWQIFMEFRSVFDFYVVNDVFFSFQVRSENKNAVIVSNSGQ